MLRCHGGEVVGDRMTPDPGSVDLVQKLSGGAALGCYGAGKVHKFAEIVAAPVLAGELSLGSAVVAEEWVQSHDLSRGRVWPSAGQSSRGS